MCAYTHVSVNFLEEVVTVTTHPTIEIPPVESELLEVWVEGFITICVQQCVYMYQVCVHVCRCFVGSPLLQFILLSLFSAHSVIDGERNAAHHRHL